MGKEFKERLKRGDLLLGTLLGIGSIDVAEILSHSGFDWLWLDMEHAPNGIAVIQQMLQAMAGRTPCLVRVPWNDHVWIKHVLDTGCDGIVVPQIRTAEEARLAVSACRYPPAGTRSVGIARAQGYGMTFQDYIATANETLTLVLQAEHIDAVENIEAILDVPGFDAIFIGPYDLSASMGLTGQVAHPDVQAAIGRIKSACAARDMTVGIFAMDVAAAKAQMDSGCTLLAVGTDASYLWKAARQVISELMAAST